MYQLRESFKMKFDDAVYLHSLIVFSQLDKGNTKKVNELYATYLGNLGRDLASLEKNNTMYSRKSVSIVQARLICLIYVSELFHVEFTEDYIFNNLTSKESFRYLLSQAIEKV